jgi:hypothetical protein
METTGSIGGQFSLTLFAGSYGVWWMLDGEWERPTLL